MSEEIEEPKQTLAQKISYYKPQPPVDIADLTCKICSRVFNLVCGLKSHMRSHDIEKRKEDQEKREEENKTSSEESSHVPESQEEEGESQNSQD